MTNGALLPYLNGLELRERKIFDLARSFFLIDDVSIKDRAKPLPPLTLGLVYGRGVHLEGVEEDPNSDCADNEGALNFLFLVISAPVDSIPCSSQCVLEMKHLWFPLFTVVVLYRYAYISS